MSSLAHGNSTSAVEVTNISAHGIWLLVRDKEFFMSYDNFPWFKNQSVASITHVEAPSDNHFHWPDIDVDLTFESIKHPEQFPLIAKNT